jgi:hypothetical protein
MSMGAAHHATGPEAIRKLPSPAVDGGLPSGDASGKFRRPRMPERRTPFWLWPNLLSLDAPVVAVVWLSMFARVWRIDYHQWQAYGALGLAVWSIYLCDRLLDLKLLDPRDGRLGLRHEFIRRHEGVMKWLALSSLALCTALTLFFLPSEIIGQNLLGGARAQFGYLFPGLVMLVAFFSITVASAGSREIPHFRNLVAGIAFSYGTGMVAHVYILTEGVHHLLLSREMLCFGLLCAMNISAIHFWEHSRASPDREVKAAHELALTLPLALLGAAAILFAQSSDESITRPFFYAILISAALLFVLNRNRSRFSLDALRVLADVAMIVPFPVFLALTAP